ncbi:MAG: M50 family metallopeptidase [Evtepia sp.]
MRTKIHISGGFGVLMAVLLYLDTENLLPYALLSCAFHEFGHLCAIWLLGGEIQEFRLSLVGAEIKPHRVRMFSYAEEFMIAIAGPVASIACALCSSLFVGSELMTGMNLCVGVFNLIPASPLDGGRILKVFISTKTTPFEAEKVCALLSKLFGLALIPFGCYLLRYGNFTLILSAVWLLSGCEKRK